MNAILKALVASVPAGMLFSGSVVLFCRAKTMWSFLQLLGAGCLVVVVFTHVSEALHLFPWMHWGFEHSVGRYLDFWSAVLGLTLFPIGFLLHALTKGTSLTTTRPRLDMVQYVCQKHNSGYLNESNILFGSPSTARMKIRRSHAVLNSSVRRPPSSAPKNIEMPRTIPNLRSTRPRDRNTIVATPEENTFPKKTRMTFVVATACRKLMPRRTTSTAVSMVT